MPGTYTGSGTVSAYNGTAPGPTNETNATSAGGSNTTAISGSPMAVYGDKPTQYGGNTIGRTLDQSDGDAIGNLTGVVVGRGLYQDITSFITALSGATANGGYGTQAPQNMLTPRALLHAVRDAINFMLVNSPTMGQ